MTALIATPQHHPRPHEDKRGEITPGWPIFPSLTLFDTEILLRIKLSVSRSIISYLFAVFPTAGREILEYGGFAKPCRRLFWNMEDVRVNLGGSSLL